MKKVNAILASALSIFSILTVASCDDSSSDPKKFNITYIENDNYEVIDLSKIG